MLATILAFIAGAAFDSESCVPPAINGLRCDNACLSSSSADYPQAVSTLSPHRSERNVSPVEPVVRTGADLLSYFFLGFFGLATLLDLADVV